ncbi:MAG: hypothetical protein KatS3mg061_1510 [Dehalococcoidia bacterium]|nr:MAG: hypothetical protein KatS3mg061_1510 [Dehalococcoidia bacterium]
MGATGPRGVSDYLAFYGNALARRAQGLEARAATLTELTEVAASSQGS